MKKWFKCTVKMNSHLTLQLFSCTGFQNAHEYKFKSDFWILGVYPFYTLCYILYWSLYLHGDAAYCTFKIPEHFCSFVSSHCSDFEKTISLKLPREQSCSLGRSACARHALMWINASCLRFYSTWKPVKSCNHFGSALVNH